MKILGIALLCVGFLCAVAGIVSLFLLPRTTLQGVSEATLVRETLQEMGYQVNSVEEQGEGRVNFNISAPKNTDWAVLERKIAMRLQEKPHPRDTRGMFAGFAGGLALLFLGGVVYRVASRPRRRVPLRRRKEPSRVAPATQKNGNLSPTPIALDRVPVVTPQDRHVSEEEWVQLLAQAEARIASLAEGEEREGLKQKVEAVRKEAERGRRRPIKLFYITTRRVTVEEVQSLRVEWGGKEEERASSQRSSIRLEELLAELLPIDQFVPLSLDPQVVRMVIVKGFVRPGNQTPSLSGSYTSPHDIYKRLRMLPSSEVEATLLWLQSVGVLHVWQRKKPGKLLFSLETSAGSLASPGREVAQLIGKAVHDIRTPSRNKGWSWN